MMKFLSAKEVEKSVDLDPDKNYDDFDVFIAVAKVQLSCFAGVLAGDDVNECNRGVDSHEHSLGIMNPVKKDMLIRSKVRGEGRFDTKKAPIHKYNWSPPDLELEEKMKIKREKVFSELVNSQEGARTKRVRRSPLRFEEEVEEPVKSEECVRSKRVPKRPLRFEENVEEEEEEQMAIPIKRRAYNRVVIEDSSDDSEKLEVKRPKKKSKGKKKEEIKLPDPSPDMSDELEQRILNIGGTDIQLLITKSLTTTDCKKDQHRLSMPKSQVVADFLKENEKVIIEANKDIPVKLIQPNFEETDINFKKWVMDKKNGRVSNLYVLKKPWIDVVKRNGFEVGNIIQVWSFRVDEKLRFAIVRLP